jgi:hypothetical protein
MDNAILSERENVLDIEALAAQVEQLSSAVGFWNNAMLWGLGAAALAAFFIVITTRLAITRAGELSTAQALLSTAKDRQLQLQLAGANKATEDERMARLQLEAVIQPRDMSPEGQKKLRHTLHKFTGRVVSVRSYALDTEGSRLATIILSVLHASGVQTSDQRGNLFNLAPGWNVVEGLQIAGPHSQDDLINALLQSPLGSDPHLKMFRKEDPRILDTAPVEIMVGVKPIAVIP